MTNTIHRCPSIVRYEGQAQTSFFVDFFLQKDFLSPFPPFIKRNALYDMLKLETDTY